MMMWCDAMGREPRSLEEKSCGSVLGMPWRVKELSYRREGGTAGWEFKAEMCPDFWFLVWFIF
jgi:hypothetical protein